MDHGIAPVGRPLSGHVGAGQPRDQGVMRWAQTGHPGVTVEQNTWPMSWKDMMALGATQFWDGVGNFVGQREGGRIDNLVTGEVRQVRGSLKRGNVGSGKCVRGMKFREWRRGRGGGATGD